MLIEKRVKEIQRIPIHIKKTTRLSLESGGLFSKSYTKDFC